MESSGGGGEQEIHYSNKAFDINILAPFGRTELCFRIHYITILKTTL